MHERDHGKELRLGLLIAITFAVRTSHRIIHFAMRSPRRNSNVGDLNRRFIIVGPFASLFGTQGSGPITFGDPEPWEM